MVSTPAFVHPFQDKLSELKREYKVTFLTPLPPSVAVAVTVNDEDDVQYVSIMLTEEIGFSLSNPHDISELLGIDSVFVTLSQAML